MKLPFDVKQDCQAIVFIGIQASGKSTFFRENLSQYGFVHINLDTLHSRHKESLLLDDCLERKISFVVDNTNPEFADRQRYIIKAKEYGYEVIGIFFQSIVKDSIYRNENRENAVPHHVISSTQNRLNLPSFEEEFDKLYFVRIVDDEFEISVWRE